MAVAPARSPGAASARQVSRYHPPSGWGQSFSRSMMAWASSMAEHRRRARARQVWNAAAGSGGSALPGQPAEQHVSDDARNAEAHDGEDQQGDADHPHRHAGIVRQPAAHAEPEPAATIDHKTIGHEMPLLVRVQ